EVLQLQADFNRSWAAISRALNRAGVEIVSQEISDGIFEVQYKPGSDDGGEETEEDEPGIFSKIFTLNGLLGGGDDEQAFPLRVEVRNAEPVVDVIITSPADASAAAQEAETRLLTLLRNTI